MSDKSKSKDEDNVHIPPCPTDNDEFNIWKLQMLGIFENNLLLDVVTTPSKVVTVQTSLPTKEYAKWSKLFYETKEEANAVPAAERAKNVTVRYVKEIERNMKASRFIMNSLRGKQLRIVENIFKINAYELWAAVTKAYDVVNSGESRLAILDQLHTVKKDKNESMIDYFSRINEIISKLKSLDYTVNHDDWRLFMLRGLKNDERYIDDVEWIRKIDDKNEWDKEKLEQYFIKQEMNMKINNKSTTVKKVESEDTNKSKVEIAAASVGDNDNHQNYRSTQ
jgi:hypothetical protein